MDILDLRLLEFPRLTDHRGSLAFAEAGRPECDRFVPRRAGRAIAGSSPRALWLVLASEFYYEKGCLADNAAFRTAAGAQKK